MVFHIWHRNRLLWHRNRLPLLLLVSALCGMAVVAARVAHATTIMIINNDGSGEGFNDPTPVALVGGNPGTTIGAQRLNAFQRAADIWAGLLSSTVPIRVGAKFDPMMPCTAMSGMLGFAGPNNTFRDFTGAPVANTWYPAALANALHGSDLDPGGDDISATFNSAVGTPGCLSSGWYYGLDGNPPGNQVDLVSTVLHELGHGLGFLTFVDLEMGAKALGFNDTFMRNLENHGATPPDYPSMTNAQRVAASKSTGNLHWVGANVRLDSGVLTAGKVGNHVRMYAPNPQQPGASVSHWDTVLTPDQLMEPTQTGPIHNPILELPLFADIGWALVVSDEPVSHDFNGDNKSDILWRHTSGTVSLWLVNGLSVLATGVVGEVPTNWTIGGAGDFNGGGTADILWRHTSGNTVIWLLDGMSVIGSGSLGVVPMSWVIQP